MDVFKSTTMDKLAEAARWLAANNIIPKGQLNTKDADALVTQILASLQNN